MSTYRSVELKSRHLFNSLPEILNSHKTRSLGKILKCDKSTIKCGNIFTSVIRINPRLNTTRSLSSSDSNSILKALEEYIKSSLRTLNLR